MSKIIGMKC